MPDLVQPFRDAIVARFPLATIAERVLRGLRQEIGPRQFAADHCLGSLHYYNAGSLTQINTDWQDAGIANWTDGNDRHAFKIIMADAAIRRGRRRVYPRREVNEYIEFDRPQYWDGAAWQNLSLPTRVRSSDLVYWDATNFRIDVNLTGDQVKVAITLKNSNAARRIRWPVTLVGLTWSNWTLVSQSTGLPVAVIPKPIATETTGGHLSVPVAAAYVGGAVEFDANLTGMTYPVIIDPTLDLQVGAGANDTWKRDPSTWNNTESYPQIGYPSSVEHVSHRYTGISGLSGATINVAYESVRVTGSSGTLNVNIYAEDAAAPAQISSAADFDGRTLTTASVNYQNATWTLYAFNNFPSIVSVIQELADSYDPTVIQTFIKNNAGTSGNSVQFEHYDSSSANAPKLHIEYTAGGGGAAPAGVQRHYMYYQGLS